MYVNVHGSYTGVEVCNHVYMCVYMRMYVYMYVNMYRYRGSVNIYKYVGVHVCKHA